MKKLLAFIIALSLLACTAACGMLPYGILDDIENTNENSGSFEDNGVWRADADYSEMQYEHYELAQFSQYTAPIYELASSGGSLEEFNDANFSLIDELYYIHTLGELISLKYSTNPSDSYAAQESLYATELYYNASNEYWSAMNALATSENADLLSYYYYDWQVDWFQQYTETDSADGWELYEREAQLVQNYYSLMSESEVDYDAAVEIFAKLVSIRQDIAKSYGYGSYADYTYEYTYSKNYAPEDAQPLWRSTKEYFVPLLQAHSQSIYLASDELWQSNRIDCSENTILEALGSTTNQLSPALYDAYLYMTEHCLYTISYDEVKVDTGYTTYLYYYNEPFLFNKPSNTYYDYVDLFHEFGHFANMYACPSNLIFGVADNDLSELQSQGMEVMLTCFCNDVFGSQDGNTVRNTILLNLIYSIVDGAMYDEFLQLVYAEDDITAERVKEIYAQVYESYGYAPYDGYLTEWVDVVHNFEYPFYYLSYSLAAVSALEIFALAQDDIDAATQVYLQVAQMDCEAYYYSEALDEAGLRDPFASETCRIVAEAVSTALAA